MNEDEMQLLREGIRSRYEAYRLEKPGRYPKIKFNSYPTPYEHLQESFREELVRIGKEDMQEALRHIPSTKVFAKIFHEGYLLKDGKLLDTCYLYSWGKTHDTLTAVQPEPAPKPAEVLPKTLVGILPLPVKSLRRAGLLALTGLVIYSGVWLWRKTTAPVSRLIITSPTNRMTVPRVMIARGSAPGPGTVWLVSHAENSLEYYVQAPIKIADDGTWEGPLYTGNRNPATIGLQAELRAFINPAKVILEDQLIYSWPKAELSSGAIKIIRGAEDIQAAPTP